MCAASYVQCNCAIERPDVALLRISIGPRTDPRGGIRKLHPSRDRFMCQSDLALHVPLTRDPIVRTRPADLYHFNFLGGLRTDEVE